MDVERKRGVVSDYCANAHAVQILPGTTTTVTETA